MIEAFIVELREDQLLYLRTREGAEPVGGKWHGFPLNSLLSYPRYWRQFSIGEFTDYDYHKALQKKDSEILYNADIPGACDTYRSSRSWFYARFAQPVSYNGTEW